MNGLPWLMATRDLRWRARRFAVAAIASTLVFGMTLLLGGFRDGVDVEARHVVAAMGGDAFVVAQGLNGPFTTTAQLDRSALERVAGAEGVSQAAPIITIRHIIEGSSLVDVYLVGAEPGKLGALAVQRGRAPTAQGEAAVDRRTGRRIGDSFVLGGRSFSVVGELPALSVWAGVPVVSIPLADAQRLVLGQSGGSTAIALAGRPHQPLEGLRVVGAAEAAEDLTRPLHSALRTIDLLQWMLWVVATAIVASVLYVTALERSRDFAVCKAIGVSSRDLASSLVLQAVAMTGISAFASIGVARLLAPAFPNVISFPARTLVLVPLVVVTVGVVGSLAGTRRAMAADPASAFGSAT